MDGVVSIRLLAALNAANNKDEAATRLSAGSALATSEASDEALLTEVRDGSREALAILFRHYASLVRGVAYRVLRDAAEADDLLQDIFVLVQRSAGSFDPSKGSARSWILQMTYRRAISRRRYLTSRHFYKSVDIDAVAAELTDPRVERAIEASFAGALGTDRLEKAFETLSEGQRNTLSLYFFEGCTLDEIAAKLNQSRGNVKHHYFRGLERLRKQILDSKF